MASKPARNLGVQQNRRGHSTNDRGRTENARTQHRASRRGSLLCLRYTKKCLRRIYPVSHECCRVTGRVSELEDRPGAPERESSGLVSRFRAARDHHPLCYRAAETAGPSGSQRNQVFRHGHPGAASARRKVADPRNRRRRRLLEGKQRPQAVSLRARGFDEGQGTQTSCPCGREGCCSDCSTCGWNGMTFPAAACFS